MLAADELAVLLGVLPGVEEAAQRLHAPADAVPAVLVDLAAQAVGGPEPVRAAQARQPGADDHHPRAGAGRRLLRPGEGGCEGRRPGNAEHLPAGGPPGAAPGALGDRLGCLGYTAARTASVGGRGPGLGQKTGRGPARQPRFPASTRPNWNVPGTLAHKPTLAPHRHPAQAAPALLTGNCAFAASPASVPGWVAS